MSTSGGLPTPRTTPIYFVGTSGRLPCRAVCVLRLTSDELLAYRHKWAALLGDRIHLPAMGPLPHPSRLVKGEYDVRMRVTTNAGAQALGRHLAALFTEALSESAEPLIAHMSKRHDQQAERDVLRWLRTQLAGAPAGLVVMHTSRGVIWYRITADDPGLETLSPDSPVLKGLPCHASEAELILTPAKLGAYAAKHHLCYPIASYRIAWLPSELLWADKATFL
ncbi:hypothetical protein ACH4GK_19000 [Streptomyces rimosus]|uniref:hypothetical protein n=1 Tax=Streptomyces rimosus TaxID=1927 RepID=UPI00131B9AE2|nr:hypothetical protein [Streptomyces rimosus]